MRCVALRNEFTPDADYELAGAHVLLSSMEQFVPEDFGLPPYALA